MKKKLIFVYGVTCYLIFLGSFLTVIGFMGNLVVPKSIDTGARAPLLETLLVDLGLIAFFGLQHTIMARAWFKRWWTKLIPKSIERSTFVLVASLLLLLLVWQWRPLPAVVWSVSGIGRTLLWVLFWSGWLIVLVSTFLINHFDLFGLEQVYRELQGQRYRPPRFQIPFLYKLARHPMMTGLLIAFWATPHMTVGHLLFALGMTAYILFGIQMEERDLVRHFDDTYRNYQRQTPALFPVPQAKDSQPKEQTA